MSESCFEWIWLLKYDTITAGRWLVATHEESWGLLVFEKLFLVRILEHSRDFKTKTPRKIETIQPRLLDWHPSCPLTPISQRV